VAGCRNCASVLVQPVWALVGLPSQVVGSVAERMSSHATLVSENRQLREQLLVANARLTRLHSAALDNALLRERLGTAQRSGLDVQLVPILDVDLDPVRQRLVLGAGSAQGVHVGQAVIDAGGLVGQVIEVTALQSVVLLLTDPDHAIPVTVARNGVRLIAYGRGARLELRDIPLSAEVEVGDEIVTSGLGGRFPPGFPVGKVTGLRPDDSHAFLIGELTAAAKLDRGQDVLLLRGLRSPATPDETTHEAADEPRAGTAAQANPASGGVGAGTGYAPGADPSVPTPTPTPAPARVPAPPAANPASPRQRPDLPSGSGPAADAPVPTTATPGVA
jgi:rod shape-determining protein MreC